jgi:hypothetical protein|tara:strand:- start:14 stop:373 length:360 start_codon:yes stop_codon:yes gene_type:complete
MPKLIEGSKFRTEVVALGTTNKTNVYTVPANFSSHLENLFVSNNHTGNVTLSLHLFHAEDNTEYDLLTTHNIAGGSYESIFTLDRPLYLHAGDIIKCTAGTSSKLVVTTSCEEFFDPNR